MSDETLTTQLAEVLRAELGQVTIEHLVRLTGGASRETWSFDAVHDQHTRTPLILQRSRGGRDLGIPFLVEDELLAAAARAGVPTAEVVVDAPRCAALGDARITRRIEGEALGPRIVRSPDLAAGRAALPLQLAEAAAAIHSIPVDAVDGLAESDPVELIRGGIDMLDVISPAFELALQWLEQNRPTESRRSVVHGDFRIGNFLVDHRGLQAVLDWELAHLGDPVEDLGWLCVRAWRFGGDAPVGGIGEIADLLGAYGDASGEPVAEDHLRWWIVAGTLRWGLICAVQASRHLDGHVRSVELAAIGRRVCENEHDLLDLLGIDDHPADTPLPTVDHGRPTAPELLTAVGDHLADVTPGLPEGDRFTLRVALNALRTVQRELAAAQPHAPDIDDAALASRIRAGDELSSDELASVRSAVTARVTVANPRWLS